MQTLSVTLLQIFCHYAAFQPLDALADEKHIPRAKLSFFRISQLSSSLVFRSPKCTLTPMLNKITKLLNVALEPLMVSLFALCNITNNLV